jgi:phosphoenolpyruvate-protein phosphotransferase
VRAHLTGVPASSGIAIGPAWIYRPHESKVEKRCVESSDFEWARLENSIATSRKQLQSLAEKATATAGAANAEIFQAHEMFLDDPELLELMRDLILNEKLNAEYAVHTATEKYAEMMLALEGEYFQARATDIRDVGRRILYALENINPEDFSLPDHPVIIVADDLAPSDTVQFDREKILGFCIAKGGPTSHVAILARSFGVPATVKTPLDLNLLKNEDLVILDGTRGVVVVSPDEAELKAAQARQKTGNQEWEILLAKAHEPAITKDGKRVEVVANIGGVEDAKKAVQYGAEGVGLLRTEFLYLDRDTMPSTEDQLKEYSQIFAVMEDRPVVVRTLDIGGDKTVSYLGIKEEANPFLGWRSIRMISERPDVLFDQFYALLQAGPNADLRIMLPMVSSIFEVENARKILEEVRAKLISEGKRFAQNIQFGIMIEVPSAAILASHFAKVVDFFSIGTNDLTQYTIAVDRTNERVANLASPFNPAVMTLIERTISAAHKEGKWVGLCGEMAGDALATPLLLGLGLDEFSMASKSVPEIKEKIRNLSVEECRAIAQHVLTLGTTRDVLSYLKYTAGEE